LPADLEPDALADQPLIEGGRYPMKIIKKQIGPLRAFKGVDPAGRRIKANRVALALKLPASVLSLTVDSQAGADVRVCADEQA
jgi:hypothetical protein